ncbi:eIF-2-alpha kinase GCN2-like [Anneissia japonica]|uniref:eIF-2-alpha kinase GCN2-like n=1 Tax=Anneissia japonica TaxID=1529436 RepID=UPI001425899C|nr:eIF-2-alpha kinase GCN2-like [Anneissia japonica]
MEDKESFQDRQENELQLLQAMFNDDFEDCRVSDAWKVYRPPDFKLHLKPQKSTHENADVHVMVDMHIQCPPDYPQILPEINFENPKGISNEKLKTLKKDVLTKAKELIGEVMILELSQIVTEFLHTHNVPQHESFYDAMVSAQKKKEEKLAQEQQKKVEYQRKLKEKERKDIDKELQRRQDLQAAIKEERKKKEIANQNQQESVKDSEQDGEGQSSSSNNSPVKRRHQPDPGDDGKSNKGRTRNSSISKELKNNGQNKSSASKRTSDGSVVVTKFSAKTDRVIHRGACLGQGNSGSTVYVGMDASTGELVALCEWIMKWKHSKGRKPLPDEEKNAEGYIKQLQSLEQEFSALVKLNHPNLVHFQVFKYTQEKSAIIVEVLMEYVGGGSLSQHVDNITCIPMETIRQYACDLIEALCYLHDKSVTHKNLKASSVFIDEEGKLRVADYSIGKRLSSLFETCSSGSHSVRFSDEKTYGRGGKKGDILKLGTILLGVIQGDIDVGEPPYKVPQHLPSEVKDFLDRCLDLDEGTRWSAHHLRDHPFIHPPISAGVHVTRSNENNNQQSDNNVNVNILNEGMQLRWGPSRLSNEFQIMDLLGKGGFGSVMKVKNKLDSNLYAIKRIQLDPSKQELTRKITREVKLLSRLHHENVVRYYNSWIETAEEQITTDESETGTSSNTDEAKLQDLDNKNSLNISDDIEKLAPKVGNLNSYEWSTSYDNPSIYPQEESSSDDEEEDAFCGPFMPTLESDSYDDIIFEDSDYGNSRKYNDSFSYDKKSESHSKTDNSAESGMAASVQYLYIQMEFCEKSTLRTAIDSGLWKDGKRVWRYFREIVEGLVHIHSQGMIHRDLKPVNIFLDSVDHVKIGDFGLATTHSLGVMSDPLAETTNNPPNPDSSHSGEATGAGYMTGQVGTALYVSPELCKGRGTYNQKVDLYSLGIIFFEMCFPSPSTGMERVKILQNLRQESIQFPDEFDEITMTEHAFIIRWLLNHDPSQRPMASELLRSKHIPPAEEENKRLNEMLIQTIANTESTAYHRMMAELFSQEVTPTADFIYDTDIHKGQHHLKPSVTEQNVYYTICRVFEKHGATRLSTPLLLPKNELYQNTEMCVTLMDHSGGLVTLPYDLRVSFARYVARNNITRLKRLEIKRIFSEKKLYGSHPRELTECSFDIVSSTQGTLIPDAEVLHVVTEIINEYPSLQARNYFIHMNHTLLLTAVLNHCGIPENKHSAVYSILSDAKVERLTKVQIQTRLVSLSITEQQVSNLYMYVEMEGPISQINRQLKLVCKGKGPNASMAKQALHELETVITNAQVLGVRAEIKISLSLVYNVHLYSGIMFQFVANLRRKKGKSGMDVLAAGGRYDKLIPLFRHAVSTSLQSLLCPCAVGVSIHLEKIVVAALQDSDETPSSCDILVCAIGSSCSMKDKLKCVRDLWAVGLKADILCDTLLGLEEIQEYCKSVGITHMVLIKDLESQKVKVRSIENEKNQIEFKETRVDISGLVEYFLQKKSSHEKVESLDSGVSCSKSPGLHHQISADSVTINASYNIRFVPQDKLDAVDRKRIERRIQSRISQLLENFSSKTKVEVVAVDLPMSVVKSMIATLDFDNDENSYHDSVFHLMEKHQKYRKYLKVICDELMEIKIETKVTDVLVLYTYKDREEGYKVVI